MTLLDSQLFQRIDSAELLTWVQEQVNDMIITFLLFHQIVILNHSQREFHLSSTLRRRRRA